jgi:hypothetical protein
MRVCAFVSGMREGPGGDGPGQPSGPEQCSWTTGSDSVSRLIGSAFLPFPCRSCLSLPMWVSPFGAVVMQPGLDASEVSQPTRGVRQRRRGVGHRRACHAPKATRVSPGASLVTGVAVPAAAVATAPFTKRSLTPRASPGASRAGRNASHGRHRDVTVVQNRSQRPTNEQFAEASPTGPTRNAPRAITNPRISEAVFGGPTHTLTHRSPRPESDHEPTHGRSPVWRADPRGSYARNLPRRSPRVDARVGWSFLTTP